jgi:hypothetical protein
MEEPTEEPVDGPPPLPTFNKKKFHPDFSPGQTVDDGEPSDFGALITTFPEGQRYRRYADISITDDGLVSYSGLHIDVPPFTGPLTPRHFATPTPTLCPDDETIDISSDDGGVGFGLSPGFSEYTEIAPQTYQYTGKAIAIGEGGFEVTIPSVEYTSASPIKDRIEIYQDPTGRAALHASNDHPNASSVFYVQYQKTIQNKRVTLLVGRGPDYPEPSFEGQVVWVSRRLLSAHCSTVFLYKFKIQAQPRTGTDTASVSHMKAGTMQKRIQVPPAKGISLGLFELEISFPKNASQWTHLKSSVGTQPAFCYLENGEFKTSKSMPMSAKGSNPAYLSPYDMIEGRTLDLSFRTVINGGDRYFSFYAKYFLESGPDTLCKGL